MGRNFEALNPFGWVKGWFAKSRKQAVQKELFNRYRKLDIEAIRRGTFSVLATHPIQEGDCTRYNLCSVPGRTFTASILCPGVGRSINTRDLAMFTEFYRQKFTEEAKKVGAMMKGVKGLKNLMGRLLGYPACVRCDATLWRKKKELFFKNPYNSKWNSWICVDCAKLSRQLHRGLQRGVK